MGHILGIDEVGRGAWAGPLVIGAVILNKPIDGLKDSKLLSAEMREKLAEEILKGAEFIGLGWADSKEIDTFGLSAAHALACRRAIRKSPKCSRIVIDGNINYLSGHSGVECIVKADGTVPVVSAASIVAKVARDGYMAGLHKDFPVYNFLNNVGYGTKLHKEALAARGPTLHHRHSFAPVAGLL